MHEYTICIFKALISIPYKFHKKINHVVTVFIVVLSNTTRLIIFTQVPLDFTIPESQTVLIPSHVSCVHIIIQPLTGK